MGRCAVEVIVKLLDILAMIAFRTRQTEKPLLENGIFSVPQSEGKAESLLFIANPGDAIFAPAIGFGASHVMGQKLPGRSIGGIILPHRSPGPVADVRPPALPVRPALSMFQQAGVLAGCAFVVDTGGRGGLGHVF